MSYDVNSTQLKKIFFKVQFRDVILHTKYRNYNTRNINGKNKFAKIQ